MSTVHVWWCKAPEVQPLTQLYTIFTEKVPLSYIIKYTFHSKMLRFNSAFSFAIYISPNSTFLPLATKEAMETETG